MQFPVNFHLAGVEIPAHPVFESLGYASGLLVWRLGRARLGPKLNRDQSLWLLAGAVVGGAIGAKLLGALEWYGDILEHAGGLHEWLEAKTIVGGLLGGWAGVEVAKLAMRLRKPTGDAIAFALVVGIAIGRVGCFLTGIADRTVGVHSDVPWAVDFGDGPRHPAQLYEIAFLLGLGALLFLIRKRVPTGALFRGFMLAYLCFRLGVDFIKPRLEVLGPFSAIQLACIAGIVVSLVSLWRLRPKETHGRPALQVS